MLLMFNFRRTPAPQVPPPTVPSNYMSREELQGNPRNSQGYAPGTPPVMGITRLPPGPGIPGQPLPTGVARPNSHNMPPPPPPPPGMMPAQPKMMPQTLVGMCCMINTVPVLCYMYFACKVQYDLKYLDLVILCLVYVGMCHFNCSSVSRADLVGRVIFLCVLQFCPQ